MKRTLLLSALSLAAMLFVPRHAFSQKHVYEDLLKAYVDEEYEKCLAKAEGIRSATTPRKIRCPTST
jgi:hypothetical protein